MARKSKRARGLCAGKSCAGTISPHSKSGYCQACLDIGRIARAAARKIKKQQAAEPRQARTCVVPGCVQRVAHYSQSGLCARHRSSAYHRDSHRYHGSSGRMVAHIYERHLPELLNDPARLARIQKYTERAALGLPLFEDQARERYIRSPRNGGAVKVLGDVAGGREGSFSEGGEI